MEDESVFVRDLRELNSALNNKKAKTVLCRPERVKSFDLQALKRCAASNKRFCVLFSDFLEASAAGRKRLFQNSFALFRVVKKAGLKIEIVGEDDDDLDFFAGFLGGKR